jgi:hypothetical protein
VSELGGVWQEVKEMHVSSWWDSTGKWPLERPRVRCVSDAEIDNQEVRINLMRKTDQMIQA